MQEEEVLNKVLQGMGKDVEEWIICKIRENSERKDLRSSVASVCHPNKSKSEISNIPYLLVEPGTST